MKTSSELDKHEYLAKIKKIRNETFSKLTAIKDSDCRLYSDFIIMCFVGHLDVLIKFNREDDIKYLIDNIMGHTSNMVNLNFEEIQVH